MIDQSDTRQGNLRMNEVVKRTGLSRSEIYRRVKLGRFPKPRKMGPKIIYWPVGLITAYTENPLLDSDAYELL